MARKPIEGFNVKWKRGWAYVHFRWEGRLHRIALLTQDSREAQKAAAREYAKVVAGELRPIRKRSGRLHDLAELLDAWIESKRPSIDESFVPTLEGYARRYVDFFESLGNITEANATTFGLNRLGQALRKTVLRELSYLREFLAWCKLHGALHLAPPVPRLPPKAQGKRSGTQRAKPVHITEREALLVISKLPEFSKTIDGRKWPLRLRFEFMWETGFRPETIARLRVPDNWRPGMEHVELANEDDKVRWGREVDLSPRAIQILETVAPDKGTIFGRHDFLKAIKRAALETLGPIKGKDFAPYDFRHGRAKDLLDKGVRLRSVAYGWGHKRLTTTDRYLAPERSAWRDDLKKTEKTPKRHPTKRSNRGKPKKQGE